ncbi:hypothetical protein B0T22DRAFT_488080 [Podospora appendiculata]|uniref:Autophagy protein n=1 Tax=Podospora appendiculata TaxID=314037 RepID=A0AAE0XJD3_9PEZI|nr:hypothetical protein B0T22DRAFT_488080 [Podospora appendiculata]
MGLFDGWFGPSSSSGSGSSNESDPLRRLDPKLRDYLQRESPIKYTDDKPSSTAGSAQQQQRQHDHHAQLLEQQQQQQQQQQIQQRQHQKSASDAAATAAAAAAHNLNEPQVPPQSLYPDGRYADIWKTYRPLAAVEAETKTDHEKLMDVLDAFKERKAQIGRAALENCADEQMDWNACMKSGDLVARMTMCRAEVQKFEHCYMTQSRLLKALGYLATYDRPPAVDEEIQMRADALYHRIREQEAAIAKAKEEGRPVPTFAPLVERGGKVAAVEKEKEEEIPAATAEAWRGKLEKLPEEQRAAEEEALRAERRANLELSTKIHGLWEEQAKERAARKERGEQTLVDKVRGVFGA